MKITLSRGFGAYGKAHKRRKHRGGRRTAQQSKLGRAAKACKGRKAGAFRACVRKHLKGR